MDLLILANAADDISAMETVPPEVSSPEEAYEVVSGDSLDFDSWTSLISEIEKTYSDNIKAISSVYESFLSWFPLCHEYWKRYADHVARLCSVERAVEIFEQGVQSATYSVGLWVDYCSFSILSFDDPSDVRRIFERALSFVGKDFLCHRLWDMYIKFELSQQQWNLLSHILIRALKFPTKSLHKYYDSFREFAAFVEKDMSCAKSCDLEPYAVDSNIEVPNSDDEICHAIKELQDSSSVELRSKALHRFIAIGERFYRKSCQLHEKIDYFENYMERDFFNAKPLDDEQLQNWHDYLDFIEKQDDFDWAVKLYERCLIPCANYPEYWMRYVEFMESKGGRELANLGLERATQVFLKNVSEVHIFNARFRERIGDIEGARAAFQLCNTESDSSFIETAINEANMETRLGNVDTALEIYDKAIKIAAEKEKMHIIPVLYIHFFHLKFLITGSADAAIDLLIAGIQQVPHSRLLLEELINFAMMHEGSKHMDVLDPIVTTAIASGSDGSKGLSSKDREDLSSLYLKFVDYCGTTNDIRKAWTRHMYSFPHLIRSTSSRKYPSNRLSNEFKEQRAKVPCLVAKQPSKIYSIKRVSRISAIEKQKLSSKSQAIKSHKATVNKYREKDNDISVKKNTRFKQHEDNAAGELKRLKRQSRNDLSKDDCIIADEEHENEVEASVKPLSLECLSSCTREKEPTDLEDCMPTVTDESPSRTNQNPVPGTGSAKELKQTNEHDSETDMQQMPSQNAETQKTDPMHTVSESTDHIVSTRQVPKHDDPNVQPQNSLPAINLHLLPQLVQSVIQNSVQTSESPGPVQNQQAYSQMWQYQYQHQQQWLQMQQSYPQPYVQQQIQANPQHQEHWVRVYQQQQQMQLYMQQMQQYQQQMPQDYHQNHQHQIAAIPNQIWNATHDQQGHGTIPSHTTSTHTAPEARQNYESMIVRPMAPSAPANIVSTSNRQLAHCSPSFERTRAT